jgi:UDP-GlcNAc:undecaprenyl-phosphate GlcNAc-1-phosphate transferase
MLWLTAACLVPSCIIAWTATWLMRKIAPRIGLIDQPAARKVHVTPTPLGGGVGIYLGVVIPTALAQLTAWWLVKQPNLPDWVPQEVAVHLPGVLYRSGQLWGILGCGLVLVVMGLLDDRFGLSWKLRLGVQFSIAIFLVGLGVRASVFVSQPWFGAVITVLWIVVLINSLNFLDNMDALCSGISLIAALLLAHLMLTATAEPRWLVGGSLLVLSGAIAGFLCHNAPPARIFMGDAGSTFLGLMLACMTVLGTFYDSKTGGRHVLLAPLCILAVPLYDFTSVMLIRLSSGKSPFQPDKNHFSHRLTDLGLSRVRAVQTVHFATLTTGLGALLLYRVQDWAGAFLILAMVLCVLVMIAILETAGRRVAREKASPP